jgi:hypothetical protein
MKHSPLGSIAAVLLMVLCFGCGGKGTGPVDATTETPSGTITLFVDALERGNIEAYLALLPTEDRRRAEVSRKALGEQFDNGLRSAMDSMRSTVAGCEVVGEEISDSRATVKLRNRSGAEIIWKCVREPDGWKVAVGN